MRRTSLILSVIALVTALGVGASPPVPVAAATTAACTTTAATAAHTKAIEVYGEPGSFSKLSCLARTSSSGDGFEVREWDGGGYPEGTAAYFTHVAADGSVFSGSMQNTYGQCCSNFSSDSPGVGHFDPATGDFQYIAIPGTGPGDVSDVQETASNEMAFLSVVTSGRPQFGKIVKSGGVWAYDPTTARSATQFCGQSNCNGPGEMAQLADGNLVSVAYFEPTGHNAGGLIVTDDDGNHITTFQLADPSNSGLTSAAPKGIEADPILQPGGESRFAVSYDLFGGSFLSAVQVFEYDPATSTVTPITAPMVGPSGSYAGVPVSYPDPIGYGAGMFDKDGTLWVSGDKSGGNGGPLVTFPAGSDVLSGTRCAYSTNGSGQVDYQTICSPGTVVAGTWRMSGVWDLAQSDTDRTMYGMAPFNGSVMPVFATGSSAPYTFDTARWPVEFMPGTYDTDDFVPPVGSTATGATKVITNDGDIRSNIMWLSVSTIPADGAGAGTSTVELPQYLVRIDLSKLTAAGIAGTNTGPFGTASLGGTSGSTPGSPMGFVERVYRNLWGVNPTSTQITERSAQLRGTHASHPLTSAASLAYDLWCYINDPTGGSGNCKVTDDTATGGRDRYARIVARIYESAFNRWPDGPGLGYWESELRTGARTALQIATFFASSAEFTTLYGSLTNTQFVDQIYLNVLNRAATPSENSYWAGRLTAGTITRGGLINEFSKSTEFKDANIPQVRWSVFAWRWKGTTMSSTEMATYVEAEAGGYGLSAIAASIMGRP